MPFLARLGCRRRDHHGCRVAAGNQRSQSLLFLHGGDPGGVGFTAGRCPAHRRWSPRARGHARRAALERFPDGLTVSAPAGLPASRPAAGGGSGDGRSRKEQNFS